MDKIIILGNGGHAKSLADAIEREGKYHIECYVTKAGDMDADYSYPVIGGDDDLTAIFEGGIRNAAIGIGFLGKGNLRTRLYARLKEIGYHLPVICDPSAIISDKAVIGEGSFVGKRVVINANVQIGRMTIINTGSILEHDCRVGDFSHISVGSILCGDVSVGREAFVGAGATIIQEVEIASGCIIGAGEVIKKDIRTEGITVCSRRGHSGSTTDGLLSHKFNL